MAVRLRTASPQPVAIVTGEYGARVLEPVASTKLLPPRAARRLIPREALLARLLDARRQRCVVVQSSCHGFDNRAAEDAVASRPTSYRGVALLPTNVADGELKAWAGGLIDTDPTRRGEALRLAKLWLAA